MIEIRKNAKKDISIILVGTNCDLEDERIVTYQEGKEFTTNNGMKFFEVSERKNINVNEAFDLLLEDIMNNISNTKEKKDDEKEVRLVLTSENNKKEKERCYII